MLLILYLLNGKPNKNLEIIEFEVFFFFFGQIQLWRSKSPCLNHQLVFGQIRFGVNYGFDFDKFSIYVCNGQKISALACLDRHPTNLSTLPISTPHSK